MLKGVPNPKLVKQQEATESTAVCGLLHLGVVMAPMVVMVTVVLVEEATLAVVVAEMAAAVAAVVAIRIIIWLQMSNTQGV